MRSSFIPMAFNPTFADLQIAIRDGFAHFKQKIPTITMEPVGPTHQNPYVKGVAENQWCWVSIDEQAVDERIPNLAKYLGTISTRGDI
jgi:hypothetical protein